MSSAAVDDHGQDILISLYKSNGNVVKCRLMELSQKGHEVAEWGQGKKGEIKERFETAAPILDEFKEALKNQDPINTAELANDPQFLTGYIDVALTLLSFAVGEVVGKWVGFFTLGLFISTSVSLITIFILLPAVHNSLKRANPPPSLEDLQFYEMGIACTIGLLHGFNLCNYPAIATLPLAIIPIIQSACLHFVGPSLGNDRKVVLGVMVGAWMPILFLIDLIFGTMSVAKLFMWLLAGAGSAALFQLAVARKEGKLAVVEGLGTMAVIEGAVILKTLCTVMFVKTYEQLRENPPPEPSSTA